MNTLAKVCSFALLAGLGTAAIVVAGPLTPPGGPVASTYKTLTEVEPRIAINATNTPGDATSTYVITLPGSYYLTGNLAAANGKAAVRIASSRVTIDLNGFTVSSGVSSTFGFTTGNTGYQHISIQNGAIQQFTGGGINLNSCDYSRITGVRVNAGGQGIDAGSSAMVTDCVVSGTSGNGIMVYSASRVARCLSSENTGHGFVVGNSSCAIEQCTASQNMGDGFQTNNSLLTDCVSDTNDGNGFLGSYADNFQHCRAGYNKKTGFVASNLAMFDSCSSLQNSQLGISMGNTGTARNCVISSNSLQGIKATDRCTIVNNDVRYNGGVVYAGIWCNGDYNHVESNRSNGNAYGIYVGGTNNVVIKNDVSNSDLVNYYIIAGNRVGPVVSGSTNAAINGNSGGGLGFTDTNANFAY